MQHIRLKKNFPTGTFIPFPQRFIAIIQLCIAFSVIIWTLAQPFIGEYYSLRSRLILYEYVMGTSQLTKDASFENKLLSNQQLFNQLPLDKQQIVISHKNRLEAYATRPIWMKIGQGCHDLLFKMPLFEQEGTILAIATAICILMKIEGAKLVVWLLPLVSLANGINHQFYYSGPVPALDRHLFPSEKLIFSDYLDERPSNLMVSQRSQLEKGWNNYLIKEWLPKSQMHDQRMSRQQQIDTSEFYFTLARLQELEKQPIDTWLHPAPSRSHLLSLIVGFFWNVFAAWIMSGFKINQLKSYFKIPKQIESY